MLESVKVVRQIPQAILNKEAAEEAFSLDQADPAKSSAKDLASGEALSAAGEALSVDALKQGQLAVQTTKGTFPADGIFVLRSSVPAGQLFRLRGYYRKTVPVRESRRTGQRGGAFGGFLSGSEMIIYFEI